MVNRLLVGGVDGGNVRMQKRRIARAGEKEGIAPLLILEGGIESPNITKLANSVKILVLEAGV